jgi:kynurenine formamidase
MTPSDLLAEEAVLFSNRARWDPPCALRFIGASQVVVACGLPRRGWAIACTLPPGTGAPPDAAARLAAAAPLRAPIVGRGVLLDLARSARRAWLEGDTSFAPAELDECAERQGVAVESGDVVLVRTGWLAACTAFGRWEAWRTGPAPGLSPRCARWLYEREVALVAADTPWVEARAAGQEHGPLREVSVEHTGVVFGEAFHLDALAEACAADGDYAFLFVCPAPDPAADGAVRPVAVK